jgi:hypothetical protein
VDPSRNWYLCTELPEEYPAFSPLAYSLDVLLPLIDLQQERFWSPLTPTPVHNPLFEYFSLDFKHIIRLALWFEMLFGWLASLMLVAVVSTISKRTYSEN